MDPERIQKERKGYPKTRETYICGKSCFHACVQSSAHDWGACFHFQREVHRCIWWRSVSIVDYNQSQGVPSVTECT